MKEKIHPKYGKSVIVCSCGAQHEIASTKQNLRVDVCSQCHPFFTGEQRIVDTAGRVDKFLKKLQKKTR